jgi:hypothetical protein
MNDHVLRYNTCYENDNFDFTDIIPYNDYIKKVEDHCCSMCRGFTIRIHLGKEDEHKKCLNCETILTEKFAIRCFDCSKKLNICIYCTHELGVFYYNPFEHLTGL